MSAPSTTDKDIARIDAELDALLAEFDPQKVDNITFRGARFDRGLAWVHFPTGHGGLDMRPDLNRRAGNGRSHDPSPDRRVRGDSSGRYGTKRYASRSGAGH